MKSLQSTAQREPRRALPAVPRRIEVPDGGHACAGDEGGSGGPDGSPDGDTTKGAAYALTAR